MSTRVAAVVASALLAGLTIAPRCAVRSPPVIPSEARDLSLAEREIPRRSAPRNDRETASARNDRETASARNDRETASARNDNKVSLDEFRETIRPILSARCGKCHDPGGRMYARLPFDDPQVVSSHSPGVLRRLKGDDRAAMEKWLAGLAPVGEPR